MSFRLRRFFVTSAPRSSILGEPRSRSRPRFLVRSSRTVGTIAPTGRRAKTSSVYCRATIWMGKRIASPEMLSETELLPHLICSPPVGGGGDFDEAGQHGSARWVGGGDRGGIRRVSAVGEG